jgi:hypothetical protein
MEDEKKRDKMQYTVPKLAPLSQGDFLVSEGGGCSTGTSFVSSCGGGSLAADCVPGSSASYCSTGYGVFGPPGCSLGSYYH